MDNEVKTMFLNKNDFDEVKGRLTFENPSVLQNLKDAEDKDAVAIDFTINSNPVVKSLELIPNGDFSRFWEKRFEEEGVTKEQLKEAFSLNGNSMTPGNEGRFHN